MADRNTAEGQHPGGDTRTNKDGETLHPYELLDSGLGEGAKLHTFGDKVWLTEERAAELDLYGSIRPWGENDHDLVDDERDLPGILASAGGREQLARDRRAKRAGKRPTKTEAPPEPMEKDTSKGTEKSTGRRN